MCGRTRRAHNLPRRGDGERPPCPARPPGWDAGGRGAFAPWNAFVEMQKGDRGMTVVITALDASNAEDLKAFHDCYYASHIFGREIGTPWMLEELRADGQPRPEEVGTDRCRGRGRGRRRLARAAADGQPAHGVGNAAHAPRPQEPRTRFSDARAHGRRGQTARTAPVTLTRSSCDTAVSHSASAT